VTTPSPTFFTALAPDERVHGSRDPLGLLPIWTRLGRRLIGNVTTVSGDLRGWTSLLVMVGLFRDRVDAGLIDIADTAALLRAEQMIAYSRVLNGQTAEVRGLNQVKNHLQHHDQGRVPIPLGEDRDRRILTSQRAAGVWGQISAAATASLLLDRARIGLMPASQSLWTGTLGPRLAPFHARITDIVRDKRGFEPGRSDESLARALAEVHASRLATAEVALYRDHVLYGGRHITGTQAELVDLWRAQTGDVSVRAAVDIPRTALLAQRARASGLADVAAGLDDIVASERLLAPMARLFSWVQSRNRQPLGDVVGELEEAWTEPIASAAAGTDELLGPVAREVYPGTEVPKALGAVREALVAGDWHRAVLGVVDLNGMTMRRRGGAPWVQVVGDRLDVRLGDEQASLPTLDALHRDLVHSYYLDPLRRLVVAWEDGQRA
jgi:hypothetical protein